MSDSVVKVETIGYGSRLGNSIKGVLVGLALFVGSIALLWWNEGDIVAEKQAFGELEKATVAVNAAKPTAKTNGKVVHAAAKLTSTESLGDGELLQPGGYLRLTRNVEMYQWIEESKTEKKTKTGGSETRTTTYSYHKGWHEGRVDSSEFQKPEGHANPPLHYKEGTWTVEKSTFGAYNGGSVLENFSDSAPLKLTSAMLTPTAKAAGAALSDGKIFLRPSAKALKGGKVVKTASAPDTPQLGDVRIAFRALKPTSVSVIAVQDNPKTLSAYVSGNGKQKFLVSAGSKSAKMMIGSAKDAAGTMAMIMRVVGFVIMWLGLVLCGGPLSTLLDVLPIFGKVTRVAVAIVAFIAAAVLSTVTIVVGMIAHNPIALAIVLVALVGGGLFYLKSRKRPTLPQVPVAAQPRRAA